jgi:pyruvate ferredoxin oxidoreductase alpha subunit/oxalate oxidoreductase subunit alpha
VGKRVKLNGCNAVAQAVKAANVDVICSFPIRPYTGTMSELARMVAEGELDAEFVHGEGEHAQLSVVLGASAAGARVFTGTSGVGFTYAMEVYSPISGEFHPVQCMVADRTLDPPGDFGSEHTEAMTARDQGWIMGWAESPQEAFDNTLMYYRIGEDPRISLPQFPCQDGYFISHIPDVVELAEPGQVESFLPPFRPKHVLDPAKPVIMGPQCQPDQGAAIELGRANAMKRARAVIPEIVREFGLQFGRQYDPFIEKYKTEDADFIFVGQGAHARTAKSFVDTARAAGQKVGIARLRFMRPFPHEELAQTIGHAKVVGILENSNSFGAVLDSGPVTIETRAALYDLEQRPKILTFMEGLGGEVVRLNDFAWMYKIMKEAAGLRNPNQKVFWVGFDTGAIQEA